MSNTPRPLRFVYGRWRIVTPDVESCVNIPKVERRAREQWVKMSGMVQLVIYYDESFDSSRIVSIRHLQPPLHRYLRNIFQVSCKSTSAMTGRHLLWRVVRFDNIFNPLSQTLAGYFLSLLQTDFRFPCHKRWFLRPPVSQHHLAANRLSVWWFVNCLWQFAAVWVNWTTLAYQIGWK